MIDPLLDPRLVTDLSDAESDVLVAYLDTEGNWTIGRGHLLPKPALGKSWAGFSISQDVSDGYFNADIRVSTGYAKALPEWKSCDTACRQNALIELSFNMRRRWATFVTTRAAWLAQNWQAAHDGLLDSEWAAQVQPHEYISNTCKVCGQAQATAGPKSYCTGRVGRATRLAGYILTGEYP